MITSPDICRVDDSPPVRSYEGTVTSKVKVGKGLLLIGLRVSPDTTLECGISTPNFSLDDVRQLKNDIRIGDTYLCIGSRNSRVPKKCSELSFSIDCSDATCLEHCVLGNTGGYRQVINVGAESILTGNIGTKFVDIPSTSPSDCAAEHEDVDSVSNNSVSDCDECQCDRVNHGDKKARRQRAVVFTQFVLDTFGSAALSHGVLDVAGGRGEVSMALAESGVHSLVIDPREHAGCLNPRLRKVMKKQHLPKLQAWRVFFPPDSDVTSLFSDETKEFLPFLDSAQVVLGLHPDEATEGIVDWAIEHKRGFCIVPCCVFARLFPTRRLLCDSVTGSKQVRTHEDLCTYLQAKHSRIRRTLLNFEGMNICLWATAQDFE